MKIISHAWRTYKSRLVKCFKEDQNPFDKFKDLKEEDWEQFVAKCRSAQFSAESEYMQWLGSQNELDHHLGTTGYAGKQRAWEQEDERLAQQGVENPYAAFPGRLAPYACSFKAYI